MAYQCDICSKKSHSGRSHTHHTGVAGGQWKKRAQTTIRNFRPNLHRVTMKVGGVMKRVRACAKCIKRAKFDANQLTNLQINQLTKQPINKFTS